MEWIYLKVLNYKQARKLLKDSFPNNCELSDYEKEKYLDIIISKN